MSLWFVGDLHGHFDNLVEAVIRCQPEAIVLLGDIESPTPLEQTLGAILDLTEVWWIQGNHDTDTDVFYDNLYGSALADRNLHGRVATIAGMRVAGLGGVFRERVWMPPAVPKLQSPKELIATGGAGNRWRGGLPRKHRSTIFPSDIQALQGRRADILVTHEAPSCHPHGFEAIDVLGHSLGVTASFHGHHHESPDYSSHWGRLGFKAFGIGLRKALNQGGESIEVEANI